VGPLSGVEFDKVKDRTRCTAAVDGRSAYARCGSARDSHAIELTAGKLTSKSNYRTADACGRQWPVTCCRSG